MKKIQISPSILSADFSQLGKEIKRLEEGGADLIHIDVMDGHFVPNLTIGPPIIKSLRQNTSLPFDVHLMISPVHKYIENFANSGADIITIHPEATESLEDSIKHIKNLGKKVGLSLNPNTPIEIIENFLDQSDFETNGIELIIEPPILPKKYDQAYKNTDFLNDLSVVDIIMNCGKEWENYC